MVLFQSSLLLSKAAQVLKGKLWLEAENLLKLPSKQQFQKCEGLLVHDDLLGEHEDQRGNLLALLTSLLPCPLDPRNTTFPQVLVGRWQENVEELLEAQEAIEVGVELLQNLGGDLIEALFVEIDRQLLTLAAIDKEILELIFADEVVVLDVDESEQGLRLEVLGGAQVLPHLLDIALVLGNCQHEHVHDPEPLLQLSPLADFFLDPHLLLLALRRAPSLASAIGEAGLAMELILVVILRVLRQNCFLLILLIKFAKPIDDGTAH